MTVQRPIFFMHAIDSPSPLTLASLKAVIEVYIGRNDARIEELTAERRAGRPKTTELLDLEERRRLDMTEFETGIGKLHRFHFCPFWLDHPDSYAIRDAAQARWLTRAEVPDLTHYLTTRLLHQYIEQEVTLDHSRVDMLRLVRVFKDTEEMIVTKPGQVEKMGLGPADGTVGSDWTGEGAGRSADGDIEL